MHENQGNIHLKRGRVFVIHTPSYFLGLRIHITAFPKQILKFELLRILSTTLCTGA